MLNSLISAMEGPILNASHLAIIAPVAVVVFLAVLVFAFGFRPSVEPPSFKQFNYSSDEKKVKKKKVKDKKPQSNGHAVVIDVSDAKKPEAKSPKATKAETPKQRKSNESEKEKKADTQKSPVKKEKKSANNEGKSKKAVKTENEKPADFDEGEWKTAPARKEKKKTKQDQEIVPGGSPEKIGKKSPLIKKEINKIEAALEIKPIEILRIEDILPPKKEATVAPQILLIEDVLQPEKEETVAPEVVVPAPDKKESSVVLPAAVAAAPVVVPGTSEAPSKKKKKKSKTSTSEEDAVVPEVVETALPELVATSVKEAAKPKPKPATAVQATAEPASANEAQVFNELEDAWKEAPQKKSKKKARKD